MATTTLLVDEEGTPPATVAPSAVSGANAALNARDLVRMVEAERERVRQLADANARLERVDRIKSDFLTFIAHELVHAGHERLNGVVSRGLEYLDWLAGECSPVDELTDLRALISELVAKKPALTTNGATCDVTLPAEPCPVRGSAPALATCVGALLDNATKFSRSPASIIVGLHRTGATLQLSVADRGRGFPPAAAEGLFRPFGTLDELPEARGAGLSLALAAAIIQAHGGSVTATSAGPDQGSTFTIALPVAAG
jgi:signal transduction histidine kinase